jgi:hypothetical protein
MTSRSASIPRPNDGADYAVEQSLSPKPTRAGLALKLALYDFYRQSWRLLVLNTALSVLVLAILLAALATPAALVLLVLVGPALAALQHCTVVLAQTDDLRLGEAAKGLRLHWRRGLVLFALFAGVVALGALALVFYGGAGAWAWPLAGVVAYILALVALLQLALWPRAVHDRDIPLRHVARRAALDLLQRPLAYALLAFSLLVVNVLATAAALVPFLTLTIAYTFLAAAHFALPRNPIREVAR